MNNTLNIHIGFPKTGSSFIQSSLAASKDRLVKSGINYPDLHKNFRAAEQGKTTVGNFGAILHNEKGLSSALSEVNWNGCENILLSNESISLSLQRPDFRESFIKALDGLRLRLLLFIRDPVEHALSIFHQKVREGYANSASAFLAEYDTLGMTGDLLDFAHERGAEITVVNYSRNKQNIIERFSEWLGLQPGQLSSPTLGKVNRSMTRSEIVLQQVFNKYIGSDARKFLADPLAAALPDLLSGQPAVNDDELRIFVTRMKAEIIAVNERISKEEELRVPEFCEVRSQIPKDELVEITLSLDQIEVIAESFSILLSQKGV